MKVMRGPVAALLLIGVLFGLFWGERVRPLRHRVEPSGRRTARNLAIGASMAVVLRGVEAPVVGPLMRVTAAHNWGLLSWLGLTGKKRVMAALMLLDYTLYVWHMLLHRWPWLWRAHRVHHLDLDLDTSTALRFHGLEFLMSVPWRMLQIVLIGVHPEEFALWQRATAAEVMFHHSNLRLAPAIERWASTILVTPRLHGIHHSTRRDERDSNFSSGLTLWDRLHRTYRADVDQQTIVVGLPDAQVPAKVRLRICMLAPFTGTFERPRPTLQSSGGRE